MRPTSPGSVDTTERPVVSPTETTGTPAELRLVPEATTEPVSWWERRCPSCDASYPRTVVVCPVDETPLQRVEVSLPFIWLG